MGNKQKYIYLEKTTLTEEPLLSEIFMKQMCAAIIETALQNQEISEKEYLACMEKLYAK